MPGGAANTASGFVSFAAGENAQATNAGAFVWADTCIAADIQAVPPFYSTADNQFNVRATGGVRFVTQVDNLGDPSAGATLAAGGTSWATLSDRNAKKDFQAVSGEVVVEKLAAIPIESWHYKWEADNSAPHLGPMAQDFKAAFYPGRDNKSITTLEFDGVELAAIQGLNQKLETSSRRAEGRIQQAEIRSQKLEAENVELKQELKELKIVVGSLAGKLNEGTR